MTTVFDHVLTDEELLDYESEPGEFCSLCSGAGFYIVNPTRNRDPQHDVEKDCPLCQQYRIAQAIDAADEDARRLSEFQAQIDALPVPEFATSEGKAKFLALRIGITQVYGQVVGMKGNQL